MTLLDCAVTGCAYNEDRCCCKGNIKVEGSEAVHQNETCCGSFEENRGGLFKNLFKTPESKLEVECDVANCLYNDDHQCRAERITIAGDGAMAVGQTECASFREK
jgi:hypothetical protein